MTSRLPLEKYLVLDLSRVRAGPTAVRQLSDWGARVIKVEATSDDDMFGSRDSSDFQNLHRNKSSITLNLKDPRGLAVLKRLVERADVLVENFRPAVKDRLRFAYEEMKAVNPRLVYASISGSGQTGPYADLPMFDQIAQGMGGLMSITGIPGQGPVRAGIPVADLAAGLYCALGIMTALLEREQSGEGQWVQTSLLQAQVALLDFQATQYLIDGKVPGQAGNDHPTAIPTGVFTTADGSINIAVAGSPMWRKFCDALGLSELAQDARFVDGAARSANRIALNALINERTREERSAVWMHRLAGVGIPCGPIHSVDEVFADPQIVHLGMAQSVDHPRLGEIKLLGQPIVMSRSRSSLRTATPDKGEQSEEILEEFGFEPEAVADLRKQGVI